MSEKKKYIAALSSIGATKKQIFKIYLFEGIIITVIAIPLGLILSFGIDNLLINSFDKLFKSIQGNILNTTLEAVPTINLKLVYSLGTVCISCILVAIIVFLSIFAPIVNASKITIMDGLRKNKYIKINKSKLKKTPKFIKKFFKAPGELAYRNIKRSPYKFVTMTISLTISIVLFISITGYIQNLKYYNKTDNANYNYTLYLIKNPGQNDYSKEVLDTLNEFDLIDSIYGTSNLNPMHLILNENEINDSLKEASKRMEKLYTSLDTKEDGSIQLLTRIITFDDEYYKKYLSEAGINEPLRDGECILVNYSNTPTKYYDELYLTNLNEGDTITLYKFNRNTNLDYFTQMNNMMGWDNQEIKNEQIELKIQSITNTIPKSVSQDMFGTDLYLIVNNKTFGDLFKETLKVDFNNMYDYYIYSSNPEKLDEIINSLNEKYDGLTRIVSSNLSVQQKSNENERLIKEILLYSFLVLVSILCVINVFNIIISNIEARKYEFAELMAIGMSKKQINKMLRMEGIIYAVSPLIIGLLTGLSILYILYTRMFDTELVRFEISVPILISSIIFIFGIIFISIYYNKEKMKHWNISDIIKEQK